MTLINSFYKYFRDTIKIDKLSFSSKYSFLANFFNDLEKLNKLKTLKEKPEKKEINVYDKASDLYNDF